MGGAIYVMPSGRVKLRSRSWHRKYRANIADHAMSRYSSQVFSLLPDALAAVPFLEDVAKHVPKPSIWPRKQTPVSDAEASDEALAQFGFAPTSSLSLCLPDCMRTARSAHQR